MSQTETFSTLVIFMQAQFREGKKKYLFILFYFLGGAPISEMH